MALPPTNAPPGGSIPRKALSADHARMLHQESGISPDLVAERGYETIDSRAKLPAEFKPYQRRRGLLVPMYSPDGVTTSAQIRPDKPRRDKAGKFVKYETASGSRCILDVHPRMRERVRHGNDPLLITEGIKKADCLTSRDIPTVGLVGVWNWQRDGELLPCWEHVRLDGRRVFVVFDSDVMSKEGVQLALERLVAALEARRADVRVVYLPDGEGGEKVGVDDHLVAGGTVAELKALARRFEPGDLGRIRLSRDDSLKAAVEWLWSKWRDFEWSRVVGTGERPNSMRGHSCRDATKVAIDTATASGKIVPDGLEFVLDVRSWSEGTAISTRTICGTVRHLEAEGWLKRGECGDRGTVFTLLIPRATLRHMGTKGQAGEEFEGGSDPDVEDLRAPRLRWPAPTFEREGDRIIRGYVYRLGKINGSIIDTLDMEGGAMHINELAEALNRRTRDLRRRNLPRLEEAGIVTVDGDTVKLAPNWVEALEEERKLKGEIRNDHGQAGAAERQRTKHRRQREAYRNRHTTEPDPHPANAGADGYVEDLRPVDTEDLDEGPASPEPPPVSPLAVAIRDYLDRNPRDACQPAGWIGNTLWCDDLYPSKPTLDESRAAIDELGGEKYLRACLERGRRVAA